MMKTNNALHAIVLSLIPGVGPVTARKLIDHFGQAEKVFEASEDELAELDFILLGAEILKAGFENLDLFKKAEAEISFAKKYDIDIYIYGNSDYPHRLVKANDPPTAIFCKGNVNLNAQKILCVVGTRRATENGKKLCASLMEALQGQDVLIVSGLAYGIDITAHREAIKNNLPTLAVLAHGLTSIYPQSHRKTAEKMIENGGLVTEFFSDDYARQGNFPKRNRIIAGLSDACVLVEAGEGGGALITAGIAYSYHLDVLTFPGRVNDPWSKGCLDLLYYQKALLMRNAEDILFHLGWNDQSPRNIEDHLLAGLQGAFPFKNELEKKLFSFILQHLNPGLDMIMAEFQQDQGVLNETLLDLELRRIIRQINGRRFESAM